MRSLADAVGIFQRTSTAFECTARDPKNSHIVHQGRIDRTGAIAITLPWYVEEYGQTREEHLQIRQIIVEPVR